MDFSDTDETRELRSQVTDIVSGWGGGYYVEHAFSNQPCVEVWNALGEYGFVGVNIPEEYGGGGAGMVELQIVCEEAAAAGVPLLLLLVSAAISAEIIKTFGSDTQKRRHLPGLADGTEKVVFAITEPDAGSNTRSITTAARRDGDDWILRGGKYYISGADEAATVLVVAKTGEEPDGKAQLSLFLVPMESPGLERQQIAVDAMLPEKQFTLFFDDVRLGADTLVGVEGQGFSQVFHGLNPERIAGASLCLGIARHVIEKAVRYANERQVWDAPIGSHQGISHPLAKAHIQTELAALMTRKAAWLHDNGHPAGEASNIAKYAAAEAALAALDAAIQTHGGNGFSREFGLVPYWGLSRLLHIAPVTREMILNYVAQNALGLPRSY